MILNYSPQRRDDTLIIVKQGDILTINGTAYDFSRLPNGATLPREAVDSEWIVSDVHRINGEIELTLLFPIRADASHEARFPQPINVTTNGQVVLPI